MSNGYNYECEALIDDVQEAGRALLAKGVNPKFYSEKTFMQKLCADIIKEARNIAAKGVNPHFVCYADDGLKRSKWNRTAYIKRKGGKAYE